MLKNPEKSLPTRWSEGRKSEKTPLHDFWSDPGCLEGSSNSSILTVSLLTSSAKGTWRKNCHKEITVTRIWHLRKESTGCDRPALAFFILWRPISPSHVGVLSARKVTETGFEWALLWRIFGGCIRAANIQRGELNGDTLHLAFWENSTEERHKAKKGRRSKKSVKWIED